MPKTANTNNNYWEITTNLGASTRLFIKLNLTTANAVFQDFQEQSTEDSKKQRRQEKLHSKEV